MAPHEMAYSYPVFLWKFIPTSLKSDTQIPESYFKGSFFLVTIMEPITEWKSKPEAIGTKKNHNNSKRIWWRNYF